MKTYNDNMKHEAEKNKNSLRAGPILPSTGQCTVVFPGSRQINTKITRNGGRRFANSVFDLTQNNWYMGIDSFDTGSSDKSALLAFRQFCVQMAFRRARQ